MPVQTYAVTGSSFWVGMLGLAGLLPLVAFGLWGGAVADAVDRRVLLLAASLVTWAGTLALLVQALLGSRSVALLLGLTALQAAAFAVSSPARGAIVPRLVPAAEVPAANTFTFTLSNAGSVAGPLLAGLALASGGGYAAAYAVDALLFTVALWAALGLPAVPPVGEHLPRPGFRSVVAGLRFVASSPVLLMSFVVDIVAMVLAMPRALFPEAAATRFGGPGAVGWLFAAISLGSMIGGLSSGWIGRVRRQGVALTAAVIVWGLAVAASGLTSSLPLAVALLAVGGAADLVSAVFRQTILQVHAPDEMRGRMQGLFIVVVAGGPRLGDLRAGAAASVAGLSASWVGGGLACSVLAGCLALAVPRFLRYDALSRPAS